MRIARFAPLLAAVAITLAACTADEPTPSVSPGPSGATTTPEPSDVSTPSAPEPSTPATDEPGSETPPPLALEVVATGLEAPIGIARAPGGWLIVNEQAGRAVAVDPDSGETTTVLDIRDRVGAGGERGLLGLVLHPDWPNDARGFVHYSDRSGDTVLSDFGGSQDGDAAPTLDPASEAVLLTADQPFGNHNGGQLAFGPDGYLWMAFGDGGDGGDPLGNGQSPATLLGSLLRLDVSTPGTSAIPPDNPFADGNGGAPEVYLYGLRNPWRFSFDSATGRLWVADVGQSAWEEVTRIDPAMAGANLGWNVMEGAHCFAQSDCSTDGLVLPIAEYGRESGCSVTGGHVYRGEAIGELRGWYLMGDYCSGLLFGVRADAPDGEVATPLVLAETGARISAFGVDDAGELYVADLGAGSIARIVREG
ncbi:MAG: PQQ-dependent sugar dehydrogenase [Chloroflexi bacterium]|nr:PQQ-dependent sugar dehydrogenase [Chloroflexota bacterium]